MALSDNFKGAIYMSAAMAGFGFNDMLVKVATKTLATGEIVLIRGSISTFLIFLLALKMGALRPLKTLLHPLLAFRVLAEVTATFTYIYALGKLPLANAGAILQFLPLAVTLGAAIFLRERSVGGDGWQSSPASSGAFDHQARSGRLFDCVIPRARLRLCRRLPRCGNQAAATGHPVCLCHTHHLHRRHRSGGDFHRAPGWVEDAGHDGGDRARALSAVSLMIGYLGLISSMRTGEISFIAPFRYSYMIWALALSFLVFGDLPDFFMILGCSIVVASGIYTFYRENRRPTGLPAQTLPRAPH